MDAAEYEKCDLEILRFVAELHSSDDYWFPSAHKSRRAHDILAGLVVSEEIKRGIGSDPSAVVAAMNAKGINLKPAQIRKYFQGRFTPGGDVVGRIAIEFSLPEIRTLFKMPWRLLTDQALSPREIKKTNALRSDVVFNRWKIGTHSAKEMSQCGVVAPRLDSTKNYLHAHGKPEEFWQALAAYRMGLALGDWHSVNTHYWSLIANLPSIGVHPSVMPHVERLYECVRILTRGIDPQFLWFSVNWDTVRDAIERRDFGPTCKFKPFHNVFKGNEMHLGRAFPITEFHRYIEQKYPKVAAQLRWSHRRIRGFPA